MADLFTPLEMGRLTLPNRILMAPMTRCRAERDGTPTPIMAEYYAQRASSGLIITEATAVAPEGIGYIYTPGIWNDRQQAAWQHVTEAVHRAGGRIYCQIWHVGRVSHPDLQPNGALPIAPSAIAPEGTVYTYEGPKPFVTPRALETDEIPGIVQQFADAARRAIAVGFDGVEVHGANGYLIDQFLRDGSNHRTDRYGGSIENRARFLMEVLDAVVQAVGADRVGLRLSPVQPFNSMSDSNPEATFTRVVEMVQAWPLAYLHVTRMGIDQPGKAGPFFEPLTLKKRWPAVFVANHGADRDTGNQWIHDGLADAVAYGALYLSNPDLVEKFRTGRALRAPDPKTFYQGGAKGYTEFDD